MSKFVTVRVKTTTGDFIMHVKNSKCGRELPYLKEFNDVIKIVQKTMLLQHPESVILSVELL